MKRNIAIVAVVLLLGGLTAFLTHKPTETAPRVVEVKAKVVKATKVATPVVIEKPEAIASTEDQTTDGIIVTGSLSFGVE